MSFSHKRVVSEKLIFAGCHQHTTFKKC